VTTRRPQEPKPCRQCGAPVLRAHELDQRVAVPDELVDAEPVPITARLDAPAWERHPRLGWVFTWPPVRRGYPFHSAHTCDKQKATSA